MVIQKKKNYWCALKFDKRNQLVTGSKNTRIKTKYQILAKYNDQKIVVTQKCKQIISENILRLEKSIFFAEKIAKSFFNLSVRGRYVLRFRYLSPLLPSVHLVKTSTITTSMCR